MSLPLIIFLLFVAILAPINGLNPRKLEEVVVPGVQYGDNKCNCTGCNNPCNKSPPPLPLQSPPPSPKKPPTPSQYWPPPSSSIYMPGPPGNLYPVSIFPSGTSRSFAAGLQILVGCGLLGVLFVF